MNQRTARLAPGAHGLDDDGSASPGRRTLTGGVVQRKEAASGRAMPSGARELDLSPSDHFAAATDGGAAEVPFRGQLEASFGEDFGGVRAYLGRGDPLAGLHAEGAAQGEQVAFASASPSLELVAHELTHVVQARRHGAGGVQAKDEVSTPAHAAEREADAVAAKVARGERVTVHAAPPATIARKGPCYTVAQPIETMASLELVGHDVVMIEDEIDPPELAKRAREGGTVTVAYRAKSQMVKKTIPARYLDVATYTVSTKRNPDDTGTHAQSEFDKKPKASRVVGPNLIVPIAFHSRNKWDRAAWAIKLVAGGDELTLAEDRKWWNNPAWSNPTKMNEDAYQAYGFTPGFTGFTADGKGDVSADRTVEAQIPVETARGFFEKHGGFKETSQIIVGMKVFYDANRCPVTATTEEFQQAHGMAGQYHGEGIFRTPEDGFVNLSAVKDALALGAGDWATDAEVWQQPLSPEPSPNQSRMVPLDYGQRGNPAIARVAPKGAFDGDVVDETTPSKMKMDTRIENEATLKLSDLGKLEALIGALAGLCGEPRRAEVTAIMHKGGAPLTKFSWVLNPEGEPLVFTDLYMDDPYLHALKAGVGIRKRMSSKATKLNVKTGTGYNVNEIEDDGSERGYHEPRGRGARTSDIYRRHEIGYDLDKDATPEDIGAFLALGVDDSGRGVDPWNKGAEQANLAVGQPNAIDFKSLQNKIVLQGHRTKYKLTATPLGGGGRDINIELSCDHTVGRTFEEYRDDRTSPEDLFKTTSTWHHVFNVEIELEHLGVGAPQPPPPSQAPVDTGGGTSSKLEEDQAPKHPPTVSPKPQVAPQKMAPRWHPGRVYMLRDAEDEMFNTRSFQVFYRAKDAIVAHLRGHQQIGEGELGKDKTKMENLFEKLERSIPVPQPQIGSSKKVTSTVKGTKPWDTAIGGRKTVAVTTTGCTKETLGTNYVIFTVPNAVLERYGKVDFGEQRELVGAKELWFTGIQKVLSNKIWEDLAAMK